MGLLTDTPLGVAAVVLLTPFLLPAAVAYLDWRDRMAMNERCRDCNGPADFRCEAREVGERKVTKKAGVQHVIQPYLTFFLCASCCSKVVASDQPPRRATALPHHRAVLLDHPS